MTYPPADLVTIQHYLHAQTGQAWDALGILHGSPQGGGYHEGNDLLAAAGRLTSDYSKRESARDRPGTDGASALDIGGGFARFRQVTLALVSACLRGDPRTRDVREVIYTPDGATVRRWDRLGVRVSGDDSHLSHTHVSFHRDSEGRRDRPDNFLGLMTELFEGVDMALTAEELHLVDNAQLHGWAVRTGQRPDTWVGGTSTKTNNGNPLWDKLDAIFDLAAQPAPVVLSDAQLDALAAKVAALIAPLVSAPAAAIADELARRLGNG